MGLERSNSSSDVRSPLLRPERPAGPGQLAGPGRAGPLHKGVSIPPTEVQGRVNGPLREPLPNGHKVVTCWPLAIGQPAAQAVARDAQTFNQLINQIEKSRAVTLHADGSTEYGPLPPLATQLIGQMTTIGKTCQLLTDGPAVGKPLQAQLTQLRHFVGGEEALDGERTLEEDYTLDSRMAGLKDLAEFNQNVHLGEAFQKVATWTDQVRSLAHERIAYIQQSLASSPLSAADHYRTGAGINAAAEEMLDKLSQSAHDEGARKILAQGRQRFAERRLQLLEAAKANQDQTLAGTAEAGVKRLTGLSRLLHPVRAREERAACEAYATQLAAGLEVPRALAGTNEMSVVEAALGILLRQAGLSTAYSPHALLEKEVQNRIDANPAWKEPVRRQILLPLGDLKESPAVDAGAAVSVITPAPALLSSYQGRGVNSYRSAETAHAANLASTQLKNPADQKLFQGVRHGVLSAFALTPKGVERLSDDELTPIVTRLLPQQYWVATNNSRAVLDIPATVKAVRSDPELLHIMRAKANENRAREVVALTVAMNPQLRAAALQGKSPEVSLLSLSLLTPDSFRRGADDNESLMLADQVEVWSALSGLQMIDIPDDDGKPAPVNVNVKPVAMNYGVNQGAVKGIGGIRADAVSGWHISDALNEQGLRALFGDDLSTLATSREGTLGQRIDALERANESALPDAMRAAAAANSELIRVATKPRENGEGPELITAAQARAKLATERLNSLIAAPKDQSTPLGAALELQRQIAAIHAEGAHRTAGNEPYKMPTRLAVLADLLGVNVAFNCKSGKDRTGELDAEIKHFKLQMQVTGRVPHYKRTRTPEEQRHFHEVLSNSGNFEMQWLNTGYAGYKLHGVPELFSQFGGQPGDDLTQHFHGLSGFTAS